MSRHKPQPWYARLTQPARSIAHGKHRRPDPSAHSNPAQRADPTDERTPANDAADAFRALASQNARRLARHDNFIPLPGGMIIVRKGTDPFKNLPRVITTGEIIGYRWWRIKNGFLQSIVVNDLWKPGVVMEGDVEKYGVYAYSQKDNLELLAGAYSSLLWGSYQSAIGTISMWGQVVEHELGYRASHARLRSIDIIVDDDEFNTIGRLRYRYGFEPKPIQIGEPRKWRCPECGRWYPMHERKHLEYSPATFNPNDSPEHETVRFHHRPANPETI